MKYLILALNYKEKNSLKNSEMSINNGSNLIILEQDCIKKYLNQSPKKIQILRESYEAKKVEDINISTLHNNCHYFVIKFIPLFLHI